jgi:hypothetical protein
MNFFKLNHVFIEVFEDPNFFSRVVRCGAAWATVSDIVLSSYNTVVAGI